MLRRRKMTRLLTTDPFNPPAIQRLPAARVAWKLPSITVEVTARKPRGAQILRWRDEVGRGVVDEASQRALAPIASIIASTTPASRTSQTWWQAGCGPQFENVAAAALSAAGRRPQM